MQYKKTALGKNVWFSTNLLGRLNDFVMSILHGLMPKAKYVD